MSGAQLEFSNFKFNFSSSEAPSNNREEKCATDDSTETDWSGSVALVVPSTDEFLKVAKSVCNNLWLQSHCIKHLPASAALERAKSEDKCSELLAAEARQTDLEPGLYEGGFKTWECSLDLAKYLETTSCFLEKPKVLELGCGSAIPGLLAYISGCSVTFQDFNKEVLEYLTIPNVFLNTPDDKLSSVSKNCCFLSGHWQGIKTKYFGDDKPYERFDVILSSETIYNQNNHRHLLELMKMSLKPSGIIYLAAKTHYFGVGGTLQDFLTLITLDGKFESKVVYESTEGVRRKIVAIQFAKK